MNNKKKVLFTATVDSHIELFHLPFLKYFKERGYEVHVATNGADEIKYCDKKIKIDFERNPFRKNNIKAIFQLKKVLDKEKYDIIHTHTPMGSVITRIAAKSSRKRYNTKVLYTAHGFHFYKGARKLNWLLFYPVEKYLSKYTDVLILINKEDYDLAKSKFKKCKNIQYVPGVGIDESRFDINMTEEEKLSLRKSIGLKKEDIVLIYLAELSKRKNQMWLISAIKSFVKEKNIHLLLCGKDSMNGLIQQYVKENNLEDNVHVLGFRTDIPQLLNISDIVVSSSRHEGLPINIVEAMYVGLPIIATDCRGNRDLVIDGENGYIIEQGNSQKLLNSINSIISNNKIKLKFKQENQKLVEKYLIQNIMKYMMKIYEDIEKDNS